MGHRLDLIVTGTSFCVVVVLFASWFSPIPLFVSRTVQWELILAPNCNGSPAEKYIPGGETVLLQFNTTAPYFSPGGVYLNTSGPDGIPFVSQFLQYAAGVSHPGWYMYLSNTVAGDYSFMACAVYGAPDAPVYLNGSYALSPIL